MSLLMKGLEQSRAVQERRRKATGETTGVRAAVWAIVIFAFLGLVCVVAWYVWWRGKRIRSKGLVNYSARWGTCLTRSI